MRNEFIELRNTRFIYQKNFSGDPMRDKFKSTKRTANIIIPNPDMALQMQADGFNVKETKPREGEEEGFIPLYFVKVTANYDPPRDWMKIPDIRLRSGGTEVLLDKETVSRLDFIDMKGVPYAKLSIYVNQDRGTKSLYIDELIVEQDLGSYPYAAYDNCAEPDDGLPFDN